MLDKLKQIGQLKAMQDQIKKEKFEVEKQGIKVVVSGSLQIEEIIVLNEMESETLVRAIKDCTNEALKKAQFGLAQKIQGMGLGF
ncbi:MAG: YbaB/EbfC family nucleoid-associated protein [Candidatus Buchananbacteria bacterium]